MNNPKNIQILPKLEKYICEFNFLFHFYFILCFIFYFWYNKWLPINYLTLLDSSKFEIRDGNDGNKINASRISYIIFPLTKETGCRLRWYKLLVLLSLWNKVIIIKEVICYFNQCNGFNFTPTNFLLSNNLKKKINCSLFQDRQVMFFPSILQKIVLLHPGSDIFILYASYNISGCSAMRIIPIAANIPRIA